MKTTKSVKTPKLMGQQKLPLYKQLASLIPQVVCKRNNIPALGCVLIDADKGVLSMTDLDIFASISDTAIEGSGHILVNAYTLYNIAKATKKNLKICLTKTGAKITSDGDVYTLESIAEPSAFPLILQGNIIAKALNVPVSLFDVAFCASTEATRYYINGVNLNCNNNKFNAVSTNGHGLALRSADITTSGKFDNIIVPSKAVYAIKKITDKTIDIMISENGKLSFIHENILFITKLIHGKFPDYNRVIPSKENATTVMNIDGKEFARICNKSSIISDIKNPKIRMFGGNSGYWLRIEGEKSILEKKMDNNNYPIFKIGFNANYMQDIISDMKNKSFTLHISDASSPMLIENEGNLYVLMPMRY